MRDADITQNQLLSYRTLEDRVPASHPIRKLRTLVDLPLRSMDSGFAVLYVKTGRLSIPSEGGLELQGIFGK